MEYDYLKDFCVEIEVIADYLKSKNLDDSELEEQVNELIDNLNDVFFISQKLQENVDKLEEINFSFSLNKELWEGIDKEGLKIDGFKNVPMMILLRKIHDILLKGHENIAHEPESVKIEIEPGVFNLLMGTFGVNNDYVFNQRIVQFETSEINLEFKLVRDESKNLHQLKLTNDFFDRQFGYTIKEISIEDEGLSIVTQDEVYKYTANIIKQIEVIQSKIKNLLEKGESEFEELDESAFQKKNKIRGLLKQLENEFDEYLELEEYYLLYKKEIQFLQKNIEYSPETKFIIKFIHDLTEIEKEYYDITQLRIKLGINFPTIKESLARLGFRTKTDPALGKDYIEISDNDLKWYISHFPEESERLIKTLSLRKYKSHVKYLGTKRLAQFIKNGYFYFHQIEEAETKELFLKTGIQRGWINNIKKQLPESRKKILGN